MYIRKNFSLMGVLRFSGAHLIWLTLWMGGVAALIELTEWEWLTLPWLPTSVIGTAVAFYLSFKNNQAYDRLWEARKIWGAIVNSSRSWGTTVRGFVSPQFVEGQVDQGEVRYHRRRLVFRHIAWLYTLRNQLLIPTEWEHVSQRGHVGSLNRKRQKRWGVGLLEDETTEKLLQKYLPKEEYEPLINYKNTATQIIDYQSQDLAQLREKGFIDDFRHMEMQNLLNTFYDHQGKCERIKKFPLPRQYASMSFIFVGIFIFLLPFSMVPELMKVTAFGGWIAIPIAVLIGWVYLMMELVGDYSENPFEGLGNDIPMKALCRTIEIDLLEMVGEEEVPAGIKPVNGVLM